MSPEAEIAVRVGTAATLFAALALWEWRAPRRRLSVGRRGRWFGNIGIGYSYGGSTQFVGQRFAGRTPSDPPGKLTMKETVLVEGEDIQTAMRWQDYTTTAIDPNDDCTVWYVGDYIKKGASSYSSRIGAFKMPGCR